MAQKLLVTPIISVIIATRNRQATLARFLARMRELPPKPWWELVVVDNGSLDGTDRLLASFSEALPLVVVNEPRCGKSRALNEALKLARGEILLFADDDIIPDPNWLSALHRASIEYPEANVFGGRILVDRQTLPGWVVKSHNLKTLLTSEQDFGNQTIFFDVDCYPMGPNLAVRRRMLEQGRFEWPVDLGPGTSIPVGDERFFLMQISPPNASDRLYVAGSIVRHTVAGRDFKIVHAVKRCFLGGYAAGLVARRYNQYNPDLQRNLLVVPRLAWQRYRQSASAREIACGIARAAGTLTGRFSPFLGSAQS